MSIVINGVLIGKDIPSFYQGWLDNNTTLKAANADPSILSSTAFTMVDGEAYFEGIYLDKPQTLTGVAWAQNVLESGATHDQTTQIGLYSSDGTTLTLVASCANDTTLWSGGSGSSINTKAFTTPYTASAGTYYVAAVNNTSVTGTAPTIGKLNSSNVAGWCNGLKAGNKFRSGVLTAQNSLPSTQALSGLTAAVTKWFGLY